ncbi:hypothetical protein [Streptomyces sp. NPDC097610]|uniref:hypothetical protein n=1 Tax=Streptomyces sp. NPDC097610 TaxID=3157227 RepID=UPI003333DBE1
MFRSRLATAAIAAGAIVGIAPLAMAAPAAAAVSSCVDDLQAAQTANNAAIAADTASNPAGARTHNLTAAMYLVAAMGDCQGPPKAVGSNILTASATNAIALLQNLLGNASAALGSEQAAATAISQALANAT